MSRGDPAGKRADGSTAWIALATFAVAMAVHGVVALQYRASPFFDSYVSDALSYHQWARRIAEAGLGAEPVFHQPPLFPVVLATVYRLAASPAAASAVLLLQSASTSLAIALLVVLGRVYFRSTTAGVAAAAAALLHGPLVFHSLKLLPIPLALATQTAALVALGRAAGRRAVWCAPAGLAWGLAFVTRAETVLFLPFAVAATAFTGSSRRSRWARVGLFVAGTSLAVVPVTVHNARQGDLVLIASAAGENLFIGNQRGAEGGHTPLHPEAGDLFSQRALAEIVAEEALGRDDLRPSEISRYWRARALEEIRAAPGAWLRLEGRKLARILDPGDPTDMYSFALERRRYLHALFFLPLTPWGLWVLGAVGAVLAWRRCRRTAWPLYALAAVHFATLMLFFVSTRLRLPLLFLLAPFAGVAVEEGWRRWRARDSRAATAWIAIVVLSLSVADAIRLRAPDREVLRLASVLSGRERTDESLSVLRPLIERAEPYPPALDQAGWVHYKRGDFQSAARRYREALAADLDGPRRVQVHTRLALAYEALGRLDAAAAQHDEAVSSPHASAGTFYERAKFRIQRGDRSGAISDLLEAAGREPRWQEPRGALRALGVEPP